MYQYQYQLISTHKIPGKQDIKVHFGVSRNHTNNKMIFGTTPNKIGKSTLKKQPITYKTSPNEFKTKNPHNIYLTNNTNNKNFQKQKSNKVYKNNIIKTYLSTKLIKKQHKYYKTIKILNIYKYYFITPSISSMHQNPHITTTCIPKDNTYPPPSHLNNQET